jgi:hypothetical protein
MNSKIIIENLININEDLSSGKGDSGMGKLNFLIEYLKDEEEKKMLIELEGGKQ